MQAQIGCCEDAASSGEDDGEDSVYHPLPQGSLIPCARTKATFGVTDDAHYAPQFVYSTSYHIRAEHPMGGYGWRGHYGNRDGVDGQTFEEWRTAERARMREVMRARRARLRELRGGEPAYPELVLASMTRWIDAHRGSGEMLLAQVVFYMRKAARAELGGSYEAIQDRGTAKYLRALGFKLYRASDGIVVQGLR